MTHLLMFINPPLLMSLKHPIAWKKKEITYSLEVSNNSIEIQNKSLTIKIIPSAQGPIISKFNASNYADKEREAYIVESGKAFMLNWDVRNALYIELQKNGQPYKKISSSEKNMEITEVAYDGKEREINYTLQASNDSLKIKSNPLTLLVREAIPVRPIVNQFKVNKHVLRNGGYFTLKWDVQNTTTVELYK